MRLFVAGALLVIVLPNESRAAPRMDSLAAGFETPPESAKPRVWWHWMNGNVIRAGIRKDIAWMKRAGIGGMTMFNGNLDTPVLVPHPAEFMSPQWKGDIAFAAREAAAARLEFSISTSDGWSLTGGPSVVPADAMKKIVWSSIRIDGGRHFGATLPHPPIISGPYQDYPKLEVFGNAISTKPVVPPFYSDVKVIAFRLPSGVASLPLPTIETGTSKVLDAASLADGQFSRAQPVEADPSGRALLHIRFSTPQTVRALTIGVLGAFPQGEIDVRDSDGRNNKIADIDSIPGGDVFGSLPARTISFPRAVTARSFDLVLRPPKQPGDKAIGAYQLSELELHAQPRVNRAEAKSAFDSLENYADAATPPVPPGAAIAKNDVVDLTDRMTSAGTLDWNVPPGRWEIMRFGSSLTGHRNSPATDKGEGLEVDKLDRNAVRKYLEDRFTPIFAAVGRYRGKTGLQAILNDSYEAGQQNWSPVLLAEFRKRRGYDPTLWLPVLAGRVIESAQASDRFLADYRQTIVDLFADAHYRTIADFAHSNGLKYYAESMAGFSPAAGNEVRNRSFADYPMAEFWDAPPDERLVSDMVGAASAAHVFGHRIVEAESFTFAPNPKSLPFSATPARLKPEVDRMFAHGLNRVTIHTSVHQAIDNAPGITLGPYGQYFTRHETWAELASAWTMYLARSSYMLQQGEPVRDVLSFLGDGVRVVPAPDDPGLPPGYKSDYTDETGLLNRVSVRNGRIVTSSGMSYRLLALPTGERRIDLKVLTRIRDLVAHGAVLVGPKPEGASGLEDSDSAIRALADQLWGAEPGAHRFGKGWVTTGSVGGTLAALGVEPDFQSGAKGLVYEHRHARNADIYFVANPGDQRVETNGSFRVAGRGASIWNAVTGRVAPVSFEIGPERTSVPLDLAPGDSRFIVFRGRARSTRHTVKAPVERELEAIGGPWTVEFRKGWGAPPRFEFSHLASWTRSSIAGVRYYSGTATYRKEIVIRRGWLGHGRRIFIDLGKVGHIAGVTVNGRRAGIAWRAPYRVDITPDVRAGRNRLSIDVANTWVNRIVGDKQPGAHPYTFTTAPTDLFKPNTPLPPSGLLGPVQLIGIGIESDAAVLN